MPARTKTPRETINLKRLIGEETPRKARPKVGRFQLGDTVSIEATVTRHDDTRVTVQFRNGVRLSFDLLDETIALVSREKAPKPANIYARTDD